MNARTSTPRPTIPPEAPQPFVSCTGCHHPFKCDTLRRDHKEVSINLLITNQQRSQDGFKSIFQEGQTSRGEGRTDKRESSGRVVQRPATPCSGQQEPASLPRPHLPRPGANRRAPTFRQCRSTRAQAADLHTICPLHKSESRLVWWREACLGRQVQGEERAW